MGDDPHVSGNNSRRRLYESHIGWLSNMLGQLPTLLVLIALAAVGWWGHRTGWSAPSLAGLMGTKAKVPQEDWCAEHNVPDSRCIKCHPELLGENKADWCREHGVPESKCTLCHPEILKTGVTGDWCPEHGVPESSCTICHPEVAVKGTPPADQDSVRVTQSQPTSTAASAALHNPAAAGTSEGGTPARKPGKDPKTCQTHALKVQFASMAAVRKAGIRLGSVTQRRMRAVVNAPSEAEYDRTHYVQISSPVFGRVWRVDREVGQPVRAGDVIALIDAPEVGKAKAELLQQLAEVELKSKSFARAKDLVESNIASKARFEEADAEVRVARIRASNARQALANLGLPIEEPRLDARLDETQVRFLGLPRELVETFDSRTVTTSLVPLRSPIGGTVLTREAVAGELVEPNKVLFTVADTRLMWVMIDVPQADMGQLALGQQVRFKPDGANDQSWSGQISWLSSAIDDQTRTVRARAEVVNDDGKLLAQAFGTTEIIVRQTGKAVVVPKEAIQWEGCCHIVFVRLADEIFSVRKIKLGAKDDHFAEIKIGVLPGEVIVTSGSHVLKSEILKSALGAGCCAE